jgi:hypothetical protein
VGEHQADIQLIEQLCVQLFSNNDAAKIHQLITKISDQEGSERVEIVFDYGVPADERQPEVVAFNVKVDGSTLTVQQLFNPRITPEVNRRVEIWRTLNVKNGIGFPSRTDVRKK